MLTAEFMGIDPGLRFAENTDDQLIGKNAYSWGWPHVAKKDITNIGMH